MTKLGFEFLIHTAARTGEVTGAKWSEVDLEQKVWTIPADRMKAGRQHRVPLSARAMQILKAARSASAKSTYVFSGTAYDKPMSNMAFLMALRRMGVSATAHGFRSAFRDWAAERTTYAREVCEMALAHAVENKVEGAYFRSDLFDRRRALMKKWSAFVCGGVDR